MTIATRWLVDKSALRLHVPAFRDALAPRIAAGLVHVCVVTELEMGYSARSASDHDQIAEHVIGPLIKLVMPVAAEQRARDVQRDLISRGQHRAVAVPDLLVAAAAEVEGMTVLHHDGDFELIAAVTGQPVEWVVRPGA